MDTPNRPPSMVVPRVPKRAAVFAPRCSTHSQVNRKIAFYDTTEKIKSDKVNDTDVDEIDVNKEHHMPPGDRVESANLTMVLSWSS
jgi:hypothetical protein